MYLSKKMEKYFRYTYDNSIDFICSVSFNLSIVVGDKNSKKGVKLYEKIMLSTTLVYK